MSFITHQLYISKMSTAGVPCPAHWVSPKKGKKKVLVDPIGHRLHLKKSGPKKKLYMCHKNKDGCPVYVTYDIDSDLITNVRGDHNHDSELVEQEVEKIVRDKVNQAVENRSITPRNVVQNISSAILASGSGASGLAYIPNLKAVTQNVNCKRKDKLMDLN